MLEVLTSGESSDARLWSDLAAAYLVRAQRADRATDLLNALDAAQRAVEGGADLPEARFNLALTQEMLRVPTAAAVSWDNYIRKGDGSGWSTDARERRRRLMSDTMLGTSQWPLNRQKLIDAVRASDLLSVARLIRPFPAAAQQYLEEEVLPDWARSVDEANETEAALSLATARAIAGELVGITGDSYPAQVVEAIFRAQGDPVRLRALRAGHLAFGRARLALRSFEGGTAEESYRQAQESFSDAGSPMRVGAELELAIVLFQSPTITLPQVLARIEQVEMESRSRRYMRLLGRALWIRALCLSLQGRFVESLKAYDDAFVIFEEMNDRENVANVLVRKAGVLRILGQSELAWQEAWQALEHFSHSVELQSQSHLLGEAAAAALALAHPRGALLYQDRAVRLIEDETSRPEDLRGRFNLAAALHARAAIQLRCGRLEQARIDLAQASRLAETQSDKANQRAIEAYILDIEGMALLDSDPQKAVDRLTQAVVISPIDEYRSFRASILFQLARAYRKVGRNAEAEQNLKLGIRELQEEEDGILTERRRGEGEELWTSYFSRLPESYKLLISLLTEDGRYDEAFSYAERARAFEPLNLIFQPTFISLASARRMAGVHEPLGLGEVQSSLPIGTFLIEYLLLDDRVFIWIVWREGFEFLVEPVGRKVVANWAETLRASARYRNVNAFEAELSRPYLTLIEAPLKRIRGALTRSEEIERIVFIPDGAIRGLPLAALRNPETMRYLVEDFPISVAPSASLFLFSLLRDAEIPQTGVSSALLVGDPAFDPRSDLTRGIERLRSAREIERIRRYYQPQVKVLTGKEATVDHFFELAMTSTMVHFAGHAIANQKAPSQSLLLLAPSANHSGILSTEELLVRLRLEQTRLFVLSTCSSLSGRSSEDFSSLVRPLIAAGTPAVVGSLWEVGDRTTEELLVGFHRYYTEGFDAASALRRAQLDLLKGRGPGGLDSALAWAPFQVIGYASSPSALLDGSQRESR